MEKAKINKKRLSQLKSWLALKNRADIKNKANKND